MLGQIAFELLEVRGFQIDLIGSDNHRNSRRFDLGNGFDCLWFDAVVSGHYENRQIRNSSSPGAHFGKRLMTRCINESNDSSFSLDLVGADPLGNPAVFAGCDFGFADEIKKRGFAVVNVTQYRNNGRP